MSNEELARLIQNLIRVGTIMEIDYSEPPRVRVRTGQLETDWRPWCEKRAGQSKTWDPPTIGEQVLLFSPGGDVAGAYVICSIGSDANPPTSRSPAETARKYPAGAITKYNHETGAFSVSGIKAMSVSASETITLKAGTSITLDAPQSNSTGKHTVKGLLTYLAGMAGSNTEGGAAATITGDLNHEGGKLSSHGIVLHLHVHGNGNGGGDTTEPK